MKLASFRPLLDMLRTLPLPGLEGQLPMAPPVRASEAARANLNTARPSGVLLLFYADDHQDVRLVLMERTQDGSAHSGQISFPGGKKEPEDADMLQTALREAHEEVGIKASEVEVLCKLSELYIPPSHFLVYPYLGFMPSAPDFLADPSEVASILTPRLSELLDPTNSRLLQVKSSRYGAMDVPCYSVDGHNIWGATAMILSEALALIRQALDISRVS